jgi:hypothetical protein
MQKVASTVSAARYPTKSIQVIRRPCGSSGGATNRGSAGSLWPQTSDLRELTLPLIFVGCG